jgi:ABC-type multidrug transport system ATPase subunit
MLQLISVSKRYADVLALDNINVNLAAGQVVGLIGPNGAGKTTLLRIIGTILRTSHGQVLYNGTDIQTAAAKYRTKIGYVPEDGGLYLKLTPLQNLMFYRSFYHNAVPLTEIYEYLREYKLEHDQKKPTGKLSKGTRQKILFLKAILNNPELLILDEPLNYLDPEIRIRVKEKLKELRAAGKLVLLSSHTLAEVEDLCTTIMIIRQGRILTCTSLPELKQKCAVAAERSLEKIYLRIIGST